MKNWPDPDEPATSGLAIQIEFWTLFAVHAVSIGFGIMATLKGLI
jgi:hypothetical protein